MRWTIALLLASAAHATEWDGVDSSVDFYLSADEGASTLDPKKEWQEQNRWSQFLPIGGRKVRELGYELPLPFGISASLFAVDRKFEIKELDVGINGGELRPVPDFVDIAVSGDITNLMARFDAWVLPFLNVYVMAGWTWTDTLNTVTLTNPAPPPIGGGQLRFEVPVDTQGFTYGGGMTLAGGYKWWFIAVDFNYAIANIDVSDTEIRAPIYSARTGWQGEIGSRKKIHAALWIAYYYWDTETDVSGTVEAPDGTIIEYRVKQGPEVPWNLAIGGRIEFSETSSVVAEWGFNEGVTILLFSGTFRF